MHQDYEDCNNQDLCQMVDLAVNLLRAPKEEWQAIIERYVNYIDDEALELFIEKLYAKVG